jgi:hypothetical protein
LAEILYHVVLEGRRLGPYDRRTIVGMRVRKTLTSRHVLETSQGGRLTVAELLHATLPATPPAPPEPPAASPDASGGRVGHSVIRAAHAADLLGAGAEACPLPPFQGEVEVRVQTRALRIGGRFREGPGWKEDRVKFPLADVVHARLQGSVVELGIRPPAGECLQRLRLDLRTPEAAGELVEALPHTVPWPGSEPLAGPSRQGRRGALEARQWAAIAAGAMAAAGLAWIAWRAL